MAAAKVVHSLVHPTGQGMEPTVGFDTAADRELLTHATESAYCHAAAPNHATRFEIGAILML